MPDRVVPPAYEDLRLVAGSCRRGVGVARAGADERRPRRRDVTGACRLLADALATLQGEHVLTVGAGERGTDALPRRGRPSGPCKRRAPPRRHHRVRIERLAVLPALDLEVQMGTRARGVARPPDGADHLALLHELIGADEDAVEVAEVVDVARLATNADAVAGDVTSGRTAERTAERRVADGARLRGDERCAEGREAVDALVQPIRPPRHAEVVGARAEVAADRESVVDGWARRELWCRRRIHDRQRRSFATHLRDDDLRTRHRFAVGRGGSVVRGRRLRRR